MSKNAYHVLRCPPSHVRGGQWMTWVKSIKTLTIGLALADHVLGFSRSSEAMLKVMDDMGECRSQWRSFIRNFSFSVQSLNSLFLSRYAIFLSFLCLNRLGCEVATETGTLGYKDNGCTTWTEQHRSRFRIRMVLRVTSIVFFWMFYEIHFKGFCLFSFNLKASRRKRTGSNEVETRPTEITNPVSFPQSFKFALTCLSPEANDNRFSGIQTSLSHVYIYMRIYKYIILIFHWAR